VEVEAPAISAIELAHVAFMWGWLEGEAYRPTISQCISVARIEVREFLRRLWLKGKIVIEER
jgi:hypothetical protein